MKHYLYLALALALSFTLPATAQDDDTPDQEFRHVIVTLNSGEQIDCYLRNGWQSDFAPLMKRENYSFKVTMTPEDKDAIKYTADDVLSVEFTEETESNPQGLRAESQNVSRPNFSSRYNTSRELVYLNYTGENATLYWWKNWEVVNMNTMRQELKTYYGIRFHNDPENVVYPYGMVTTMLMDKHNPGLKAFAKKWYFKGKEGKAHQKELEEDDAAILDMYDAYLESLKSE